MFRTALRQSTRAISASAPRTVRLHEKNDSMSSKACKIASKCAKIDNGRLDLKAAAAVSSEVDFGVILSEKSYRQLSDWTEQANDICSSQQARFAAPAHKAALRQARGYADKAAPTEVSSILEQRIRGVSEEASLAETGRVLSVGYVEYPGKANKKIRKSYTVESRNSVADDDRIVTVSPVSTA